MTPITEVEGRRLALSNLEKVLYPATGFTKGEVLHYYATVADVLLPICGTGRCPSCAIRTGRTARCSSSRTCRQAHPSG